MPNKPFLDRIIEIVKQKFGESQKAVNQFKTSAKTGKSVIPQGMGTVKKSFSKDSLLQKKLKEIYQK